MTSAKNPCWPSRAPRWSKIRRSLISQIRPKLNPTPALLVAERNFASTEPIREFCAASTKSRPFLAGFEIFQTFDDLDKKEFRLTVPAEVTIQTVSTGPSGIVQATTAESGGTRTYQWEARNVPALPAEPHLPPDWAFLAG